MFAKAEQKIKNIDIKMAGYDETSSIGISYNSGGSNIGLIFLKYANILSLLNV